MKAPPASVPASPTAPLQLKMAFESMRLRQMNPPERERMITQLASLLMLAAGAAAEECGNNDEH